MKSTRVWMYVSLITVLAAMPLLAQKGGGGAGGGGGLGGGLGLGHATGAATGTVNELSTVPLTTRARLAPGGMGAV